MMDAGSVAFEQSLEYAMMDAGSVASEQSLESALAPTSVAAAAAAAATAAAATTSFSLYSLPDVAIGHVSSFLQFKVVARLLKVSKSTQEAVYAGETVLVFPKEATDAAVIAMVRKFHNLKLVNLCGCFKVTDAGVQALAKHHPSLESVNLWCCYEVTDVGLQALAYPGLKSVNLACCYKVTDAGVQALTKHCPDLW